MEAFLPYWLQRRRNKKMMRRSRKRATLGQKDMEMPLVDQVRLEADMSTYLVGTVVALYAKGTFMNHSCTVS